MGSMGRSLGVRGRSLGDAPEPLDGGALDGVRPLGLGGAFDSTRPRDGGALDGARPLDTGGAPGRPLEAGARLLGDGGRPLEAGARLLAAGARLLDAGARLPGDPGRPLEAGARSLPPGFAGGTDGASSTAKPPG